MALQVQERTTISKIDYNLALVVLAITLIGLINLYSATHGPHSKGVHNLFWSQIIHLAAGWIIYVALTFIDYKIFSRFAYILYGINLLMLFLVDFIGHSALGGQRWLDFGFFKYQPSETMKIVMVMVLARHMNNQSKPSGYDFQDLLYPLFLVIIPVALVLKQPDLGTGLLLIAITGTLLFFVGIQSRVLIMAIVLMGMAVPLAWKYGLKEYQKNRVLTFVDPYRDPRGAGYNSIQSKIAVGSGKLLGKGFRKGTQSQLEFLPERHTDFIFSVLSEEHGFVGGMTTLGLFTLLFIVGVRIASQAKDRFGVLMAIGLCSIIFWHMFINMGMTTGVMPIVGIPLPLVSYGGSSLLTTMAGLGILSSISLRKFLF